MAKKKQKKKRAAPQGSDSHLRKQERLEARRRAKEEALIARMKRERRARALRTTALVALGVLVVWFFFLRDTSPDSIEGHEIASFPNIGSNQHGPPYDYQTKPPVAGNHDPLPAACGTHAVAIKDEMLVHSFEHGAVAVLYSPGLVSLGDIKKIEAIVADYEDDVLSAPYPDMADPITVASWTRKMVLPSFDESVIQEYIDTFRDTEPAPEANAQECPNEANDEFEPTPAPSPEPSPPAGQQDKEQKAEDGAQKDSAKKGAEQEQ